MKILKYLSVFSIVALFSACGEKELPYEPFEDMQYGAYARLLSSSGEFNFFDVANSAYTWEVEFYDENGGNNVASYNWTVTYRDNVNGTTTGPVDLASYTTADFATNGNGLPGMSGSFTFQAALDAFGFTIADINGGDAFTFLSEVVKTDGSSFTNETTGPNIKTSASFAGFFSLNASVICPSDLGGTYNTATVPWCDGSVTETGTTTWTDEGSGIYSVPDFAFGGYFPCYGAGATLPGGTLQIQDACGQLSPIGASRWGEVYWYNDIQVTNGGTDLIMDWENDYGEAGITTLSRTDGTTWPALTN